MKKQKIIQLFVLPFAGGNSASFNNLKPLLDKRIKMVVVEYPGRMTRRREEFIIDYGKFLEDVALQIEKNRDNNDSFAILGYSLGSVLAFDLLRKQMVKGKPTHFFACARGSLARACQSQCFASLPEDDFYRRMYGLGGINEKIMQNKRFKEIYLKPMRADYDVWASYRFQKAIIDCNISVVYSPHDILCSHIEDWRDISSGKVDFFALGKNHFFINSHWEDVAKIINQHICLYLD